MSEETELLREIRDLLRLVAEPAIAKRDERLRSALREVVGKGKKTARAVLLMDGSRTRSVICEKADITKGNLSTLEKSLRQNGLLAPEGTPRLVITVPHNFFESPEN